MNCINCGDLLIFDLVQHFDLSDSLVSDVTPPKLTYIHISIMFTNVIRLAMTPNLDIMKL